jgi:endonuclease YncB( thermonuclease family)
MLLIQPALAALLLAMAMTMAATSSGALAGTEVRATVLSIGDGDTIRVQQGQQRLTIRLA